MSDAKEKTSISMGLDAIFSMVSNEPVIDEIDAKNIIHQVDIGRIQPSPYQARKQFSEDELKELAESIKEHGIIQPLIARKAAGHVELIAGERRWRASKLLGLTHVPVIYCDADDRAATAFGLIENIQREGLNPIEMAEAFQQLIHDHGLSHEEIAKMVGKNRTSVTNVLRLLTLTPFVRQLLIDRKIEMGHARALLTLSSDQQISIAENIVERNLNVRDVEKLSQSQKNPTTLKQNCYEDKINKWLKELSQVISSKVTIHINEKGEGKMIVHFSSLNEMDWIIKELISE